jgi:hypothetical protein
MKSVTSVHKDNAANAILRASNQGNLCVTPTVIDVKSSTCLVILTEGRNLLLPCRSRKSGFLPLVGMTSES